MGVEQINLKDDFTFIIPVKVESKDRATVLYIVTKYILKHFNVNIIIAEQDTELVPIILKDDISKIKYIKYKNPDNFFYKTKLINLMLKEVNTPYVIMHDSDVLFTKRQYTETFEKVKENDKNLVYPFSQPTLNISKEYFTQILQYDDMSEHPTERGYILVDHTIAPGGCICLKTDLYKYVGGMNEKMKSWGPEDNEIVYRLRTYGCNKINITGLLFHLEHSRNNDSWYNNSHYVDNVKEYVRIQNLLPDELWKEIQSWGYIK